MKATIFDIQKCSFVDGPGIRTTVFFKGCNLDCKWCHNPESKRFEPQLLVYQDKCIGCGKCQEKCPYALTSCTLCGKCELYCPKDARKVCGKEYTVDAVMEEVLKDAMFYETSGGGVTLSGGECMLRIDFLEALLKKCKENKIHTAVDTAGHVPFSLFERILPYTDMFLYDVKVMDSEKHLHYTGVENTLILENLATLLKKNIRVWVRVPVMVGVNDDLENFKKLKEFFEENGYPEKIELLPYHALGENKYRAMGETPETFSAPSKEEMEKLNAFINA